MVDVERAGRGDVEQLAAVLARAFHDDPVARFIFPDQHGRSAHLQAFFRLQMRRNYLERGEVLTSSDRAGAAFWLPPTPRAPRILEQLAHLAFTPRLGTRREAVRQLTLALEARHPKIPHWYLGSIGTDPDRQRQGVGSALIRTVLARCDADGIGAYLECSQAKTIGFYERLGFVVETVVEAPETGLDGPRLYLMWRAPYGASPRR